MSRSWHLKAEPQPRYGLVAEPGGIPPRAARRVTRVVQRVHPGFVGRVGSGGFVAPRSAVTGAAEPTESPLDPARTPCG